MPTQAERFSQNRRLQGLGIVDPSPFKQAQQQQQQQAQPQRIDVMGMLNRNIPIDEVERRVSLYSEQGHYVLQEDVDKFSQYKESQVKQKQKDDHTKKKFFGRVADDWSQRGSDIKRHVTEGLDTKVGVSGIDSELRKRLEERGMTQKINELASMKKGMGPEVAGVQLAGDIVGGVNDLLGESLISGLHFGKEVLNATSLGLFDVYADVATKQVKKGFGEFLESEIGQGAMAALGKGAEAWAQYAAEHPGIEEDIGTVANIVSAIPMVGTAQKVNVASFKKLLRVAKPLGIVTVKGTENIIKFGANKLDDVAGAINRRWVTKAAKEVGEEVITKASTGGVGALSTAGTGVAGEVAVEGAIGSALKTRASNKLLKEAAKQELKAAAPLIQNVHKQGVKLADAKNLANLTKTEKPILKEMSQLFKQRAGGDLTAKPRVVVGEAVANSYKRVQNVLDQANKNLKEVVSKIPEGKIKNVRTNVLSEMRKVKGMDKLKMKLVKGEFVLDFDGTVLSTAKNEPARKAIQSAFNDIAGRDGFDLHLLRQELRETLKGRKQSSAPPVLTDEKVIESIRSSLLTSLGDDYKAANTRVATLINDMDELLGPIKNIDESFEQVRNLKLAQVVRRVSSNADSTPAELIAKLKEVFKREGLTDDVDIEKLQNLLNILEDYYKVAPATGAKNQIGGGSIPTSKTGATLKILDKGIEAVQRDFPQTQGSIQKALEEFINSL